MRRAPELLAPAGSRAALLAALQSGADAVYLGGRQFNARQLAANFERPELEEAVRLAHARGARLYVTVNILLADRELEEAAGYLRFLHNIGVDAVIVQDLGLLHLLRRWLPGLPVHASTQMAVMNAPAVRWLAEQGVRRVVLARELSLEDIAAIHEAAEVELEVFVHGALCFSYSGQCLFSSLVGGRSGNRGLCAQPCRLPYALRDAAGKPVAAAPGEHLLSTRDLCAVELLPQMIAAGISSFKLEGRMKRPEYVATVVRVYRRALDRALADPQRYCVREEERRALLQAFNRDFTTGYLEENQGRLFMSYQRPNNRGTFLGRVVGRAGERALVRLEQPLRRGDGVEVWVSRGGRAGQEVAELFLGGRPVEEVPAGAVAALPLPPGAAEGDRVFKTFDVVLAQAAREAEMDRVPVRAVVRAAPGEPLSVELLDPWGRRGVGRTSFLAERARRHPLTEEVLREQLGRLGDTPFALAALEAHLAGELMVPLSELNAARRAAVADLLREQGSGRPDPGPPPASLLRPARAAGPRLPRLTVAVGSLAAVEAALAAGADRVYLGGEVYRRRPFTLAEQRRAVELCHRTGREAVLITPRVWHPREEAGLRRYLQGAREWQPHGLLLANLGTLPLARELAPELALYADYPVHSFNRLTLRFLAGQGLAGACLSPELTMGQVEELSGEAGLALEALVHGQLPLMVSEHCVPGAVLGGREPGRACSRPCRREDFTLLDRRGYVFPLRMDRQCRLHILNARDLCLVEETPLLLRAGVSAWRVEARTAGPAYVAAAVRVYREAIRRAPRLKAGDPWLREARAELERHSPGGFTSGHYFRGVL